jgi:L-lactate dehydrogenase
VLHGEYDIDGVSLSIPTIVGKNGIEARIPMQLSDQELESLKKSSNALKDVLSKNDF